MTDRKRTAPSPEPYRDGQALESLRSPGSRPDRNAERNEKEKMEKTDMKSLQEIYTEITASEELKAAFAEAAKNGTTLEFLRERGCGTTKEELAAFLKSRSGGEIPDEELDNVAGGCNSATKFETIFSVISAGIVCAAIAIDSTSEAYAGYMKEGEDGRICKSS